MIGPLLSHAEIYYKMGFALLPIHFPCQVKGVTTCSCENTKCNSPAKHPVSSYAPHGVKDASKDWRFIEKWVSDHPKFNIAIATGRISQIFALDIDPRHGGDDNLKKLEAQYGDLPETVRFLTGGGGQHILFRHPGVDVPNYVGKPAPGIDVRGDGGYIVAPPSTHASGRIYAIDVDHHPSDVAIAEAPKWLLEAILEKKITSEQRTNNWRDLVRNGAPEGERNNSIARLTGHLLRNRIDPWVAAELLLAWNTHRCKPPLSESEVMATLCSIASKEILRRKGDDHEF
jgi:hypothetical protein